MEKQGKEKREVLYIRLYAFFIPALLITVVFATLGVFPFGEKSLLIVDMNNEYIDYLAQMNETVRQAGSFLRSWNMGMGLGMLGLIAFYTSSPLNLIVLLLPVEWITEAVLVVTILKIGLCGLFFSVYARYVLPRNDSILTVAFSVAYALMAYNIAYSSNIMWLDGTALLPLVALGVEKILRENKYRVFLFAFVAVFFTSYYIGYMIALFSFLYFTAVYFLKPDSVRAYLRKLWRFVGCGALAAGCCAFLLLPAFLGLRNGQSSMWDIPVSFALNRPLVKLSAKLLPGVYDSLTDTGLPNIYCTVFALLLFVLFFTAKAVQLREKLMLGGLTGAILACFSVDILDLAWHAFEDPTWFPARYSFVFSFLVLHIAMRYITVLPEQKPVAVAAGMGILALLFVEIGTNRFRFVEIWSVVAGVVLLLMYGGLCIVMGRGRMHAAAAACLVLLCAEAGANAYRIAVGMDNQFHYTSRESYTSFRQSYAPAVAATANLNGGMYRTEILQQRNANGGMALGYNGISHYSTTTYQPLNILLQRLGYNRGTVNELRFARSTPLTNGLLGIRYVLSTENMGAGYILTGQENNIGIYENTAAFPLAFFADGTALGFASEAADPFTLQNDLLRALSAKNSPAFEHLAFSQDELINVDKIEGSGYTAYQRRVKNERAVVEFIIENPTGKEAFAFFPVYNNKYSRADVYVDRVYVQREFAYRNNSIIPLGSGKNIRLSFELGADLVRINQPVVCALNLDAATVAAQHANAAAMEFTTFQDTAVTGQITAPASGALVTTFPYDTGWSIKIDGKKAPLQTFSGVFIAVQLEQGAHNITMRYSPPGYRAGLAVSALCVAGIVFWGIRCSFFEEKRSKKPF